MILIVAAESAPQSAEFGWKAVGLRIGGKYHPPTSRNPTMTMEAHRALDGDCYLPVRNYVEETLAWLRGPGASKDHAALEEWLDEHGEEFKRRLCQGWLDERSHAEEGEHARRPGSESVDVRSYTRQIECGFGRVAFRRLGHEVAGQGTSFPLDRQLNLPANLYSHPLRQRVVEEARDRSWDRAVEHVDHRTGGHVPKRQAQELAIKATQDYDEFYKQREARTAMGASALLLGSSDCKGVRMLPSALREATRKAAAAEKADAVRGDPMAQKKPRSHDKRMAVAIAVWEQEPEPRQASDIVSELHRTPKGKKARKSAPRPQNKRVSASVQKGVSTGVAEMFDEFDCRDPERARKVGVLVDGEENQQTAILTEGRMRGRALTLVLDIIHVIHYLWLAGFALCHKNRKATEIWLASHLLMLLSSPVAGVITAIEAAIAQQEKTLKACERKAINKALGYLRRNAPFLDYPTYLAQGLPIATGIIEGACRHLIQDRLGITGARWGLQGAEAMLRLRSLHSSGDWDDYWRFHLKKEAARNYAAAA